MMMEVLLLAAFLATMPFSMMAEEANQTLKPRFQILLIGWVRKTKDRTYLEIKKEYRAVLIPVQPKLIMLSRCDIVSVKDNIIEIDDIDAFADTPVFDIKHR